MALVYCRMASSSNSSKLESSVALLIEGTCGAGSVLSYCAFQSRPSNQLSFLTSAGLGRLRLRLRFRARVRVSGRLGTAKDYGQGKRLEYRW